MINTVDDVSVLTTIPKKNLKQINDVYMKCIAEAVDEMIKANQSSIDLDIGIGILVIKYEDQSLKYRFTPSKTLISQTLDIISGKLNSLEVSLEKATVDKITNLYKGLL